LLPSSCTSVSTCWSWTASLDRGRDAAPADAEEHKIGRRSLKPTRSFAQGLDSHLYTSKIYIEYIGTLLKRAAFCGRQGAHSVDQVRDPGTAGGASVARL
jgi:hypothetical protein